MTGPGEEIAGWIAALKKSDLAARHEAEEALGRIGEPACGPLIRALREDTDPDFRWYAARALAR
ncbi:MAG: HEAT repeat domain-containing protein, partial [Methanomicrobiales archaeon]|nr:HEAT repeat domain-containing protein [Methanomicrobiales archaeon]